MKFLPPLFIATFLAAHTHALESGAVLAVTAKFDNASPDDQYKARVELFRLIDGATAPGKTAPAEVTKTLVTVMQGRGVSPEAAKYILRSMSRVATADAVPYLTELLNGSDPLLQEEARQVLESIRDPKSVATLEAALRKESGKSQKLGLLNSLAAQKAATSVPLIAPLILDPDLGIARAAVGALAGIAGDKAVEVLKKANASDKVAAAIKPDVEAALLVASSGNAQVVQELYLTTKSETVRLAAFLVLASSSPGSAGPVIEQALKSDNSELRHAALAQAIKMNLPSLQTSLAQTMDPIPLADRLVILANLHYLKPTDLAEKVALSRVTSAEQDERIAAIAALGKMTTKPAFDALLQALGDKAPPINQAAGTAIAVINFPPAETSLLAMLKGDSSPEKILAVKALAFRQVAGSNELLIEIIVGNDDAASKEAIKALYFTASIDDLRVLSAKAGGIQDAEKKKSVAAICAKIATRLNTDEARELVKPLQ